jgi:hypothetical protein
LIEQTNLLSRLRESGMPIDYRIDFDQRVVFARARGSLTDQDVFAYQEKVWSSSEVAGFDELVDMTDVEEIVPPPADRVRALANLSANMDAPESPSRFAIVAPQDFAYGLGRMYGTYRELTSGSIKKVAVFRSRKAALTWLDIEEPRIGPADPPTETG